MNNEIDNKYIATQEFSEVTKFYTPEMIIWPLSLEKESLLKTEILTTNHCLDTRLLYYHPRRYRKLSLCSNSQANT